MSKLGKLRRQPSEIVVLETLLCCPIRQRDHLLKKYHAAAPQVFWDLKVGPNAIVKPSDKATTRQLGERRLLFPRYHAYD